mmetsp:Transcript_12691/g.23173  ORF Transcript_12691/g.23173 Transcript_12691/m.23173 type:complete len:728 (-) Transcript_12691:166-2349(-)
MGPHLAAVPAEDALVPDVAARPAFAPVAHALGGDHLRITEPGARLRAADPVLSGVVRAGHVVVVLLDVELLAVPALNRPRLVLLQYRLPHRGNLVLSVLRHAVLPPLELVPRLGVQPLQVEFLLDHGELELEGLLVALVPEPVSHPALEDQRQHLLPALLKNLLPQATPVEPHQTLSVVVPPQVLHVLHLGFGVDLVVQQQFLHPHHSPLPGHDLGLVRDDDGQGPEVQVVELLVQHVGVPALVKLGDGVGVHERGLLAHELVVLVPLGLDVLAPLPPRLGLVVGLDALVAVLSLLLGDGLHAQLLLSLALAVQFQLVAVRLVSEELLLDFLGLLLLLHPLHLPARVLDHGLLERPLPFLCVLPLRGLPPGFGDSLLLGAPPLGPLFLPPDSVVRDLFLSRQEQLSLLVFLQPRLLVLLGLLRVVTLLAAYVRVDLGVVDVVQVVQVLRATPEVHLGLELLDLLRLLLGGPNGPGELVLVLHLLDLLPHFVPLRAGFLQLGPPHFLGARAVGRIGRLVHVVLARRRLLLDLLLLQEDLHVLLLGDHEPPLAQSLLEFLPVKPPVEGLLLGHAVAHFVLPRPLLRLALPPLDVHLQLGLLPLGLLQPLCILSAPDTPRFEHLLEVGFLGHPPLPQHAVNIVLHVRGVLEDNAGVRLSPVLAVHARFDGLAGQVSHELPDVLVHDELESLSRRLLGPLGRQGRQSFALGLLGHFDDEGFLQRPLHAHSE